MIIDLKIPDVFEPLFREQLVHYREIFYAGGRGSGKTTNAVNYLAIKFIKEPKTNILCLREYAKSTSNSVKAEFDAFFADYGFLDLGIEDGVLTYSEKKRNKETIIKVKTTIITNNINGNKIIFAGITKHTVRALKSLKGIKYCFIDESDFLGEAEYRVLKPTIRADGAQIIACFNPKSEDDYIYQLFLTPNERRYCKKVNYTENPFFPKVLDDDRKDDEKNLPYAVYAHIWEGFPLENIEGAIFSKETIELMKQTPLIKTYDRSRYSVVCIACDPATTSKDYSNEYGIIALGKRHDGVVEVIDDLSGNKTPEQFVSVVDSAYSEFDCDYVVVETNQGGDFIKHSIITKNPLIKVREVRAVKDKINRATPVSNLASLGKVVLANQNRESLVRQMRRLTNMGYFGVKGESPDRLDALVWGVYDLLGINETRTEGLVFKRSMLACEDVGLLSKSNVGVLYVEANDFGLIIGDLYKFNTKLSFKARYAIKGETSSFEDLTQGLEVFELYCNDIVFGRGINMQGLRKKAHYQLKSVSEIALGAIPTLAEKVNVVNCKESLFLGSEKNWLLYDLLKYQVEDRQSETALVCAFCGLLSLI